MSASPRKGAEEGRTPPGWGCGGRLRAGTFISFIRRGTPTAPPCQLLQWPACELSRNQKHEVGIPGGGAGELWAVQKLQTRPPPRLGAWVLTGQSPSQRCQPLRPHPPSSPGPEAGSLSLCPGSTHQVLGHPGSHGCPFPPPSPLFPLCPHSPSVTQIFPHSQPLQNPQALWIITTF